MRWREDALGEVAKLVANRQSNAQSVITALEVHAKGASAAIRAILFPKGKPKHVTVELLIDTLARVLAAHAEAIGDADRAHGRARRGSALILQPHFANAATNRTATERERSRRSGC